MKHNDIMPECYIDSTLVGSLLDAQVNHKHCCNDVAKEMKNGKFKDKFAVGIIDNDKRKVSYVEEFKVIGRTDNLVFLKHRDKHHYIIKVGKEHKAMESFIMANVVAMEKSMEDFNLPSNLEGLIKATKDNITTQKDPRILKVCKVLQTSHEGAIMKNVLEYLAENKYHADIEELKKMINA